MNSPCTIAILQARTGSSRLPGKVLQLIEGKPMLLWSAERARTARTITRVAVATTTDPADDPIEILCRENGLDCFRGNVYDVLDRYYQAARAFHADIVVRLTGDCPLLDPDVIDQTVQAFLEKGVDFAANRLPPPWKRTFPIGLDTEVVSFSALERAWQEARLPYEREHVLPYLYDLDGRFRIHVINAPADYGEMRWTVDTPADLEVVRKVAAYFAPRTNFSWLEVLEAFQQHPEWAQINAAVQHKTVSDVDQRFIAAQE